MPSPLVEEVENREAQLKPKLPDTTALKEEDQKNAASKIAYIYVLCDPRTGFIRYVGKTFNVKQRMNSHISSAPRDMSHKGRWIASLLNIGLRPTINVIEEIASDSVDDWQEAERYWVSSFKFMGFNLANLDSGGNGGKSLSTETRAKISASHKGKPLSEAHRAKLRGKKASDETRRKLSEGLRRRHPSTFKRAGDSMRGKKRSAIACARISAALKGRQFTPEWIEKLSKSHKGNKHTEESKLKISATLRRRIANGEIRHHSAKPTQQTPIHT